MEKEDIIYNELKEIKNELKEIKTGKEKIDKNISESNAYLLCLLFFVIVGFGTLGWMVLEILIFVRDLQRLL